jgi:phosphopantetheinyl transferase
MNAIFTEHDAPFSLAAELVTQTEFNALQLNEWLTDAEQTRYDELQHNAVVKRCRQWLLGRYAAKCACRRWLEEQGKDIVEWCDIQVSNSETGMPFLTIQGIENPPTLSIAHSGEVAIAAVAAPGNPIGVDIESRTPHTDLHALAKRITSEIEYQRWFADIKEAELPKLFHQLWLAKEATAKCTGRGLQWQPGTFDVLQLNEKDAEVSYGKARYAIHYENRGTAFSALAWLLPG